MALPLQHIQRLLPALPLMLQSGLHPFQIPPDLVQRSRQTNERGGPGALRQKDLFQAYDHVIRFVVQGGVLKKKQLQNAVTSKLQILRLAGGLLTPSAELQNFRAYAEVSRHLQSPAIQTALYLHFIGETHSIVNGPDKFLFLWCYAVHRANMEVNLERDCYRGLLDLDPQVPERIAMFPLAIADKLARIVASADSSSLALAPPSRGRDMMRGRRSYSPSSLDTSPSGQMAVFRSLTPNPMSEMMGDGYHSGSSRAVDRWHGYGGRRRCSAPPASRILRDETDKIQDAAQLIHDYAPELARLRLTNGV